MISATIFVLLGLGCVGIIILAFVGGGAYLIYRTRQSQNQADASQGWSSVTGQVVESDVSHRTTTDADGAMNDSYAPRVRYTYRVNDADYAGDKIVFGFMTSYNVDAKAREVLTKYPVGQQVTVYYDPANPENAVLERKAGSTMAGMIIGVALIIIGLCIACALLIGGPAMMWFRMSPR
jgi:uncharacterized protein DUF3592